MSEPLIYESPPPPPTSSGLQQLNIGAIILIVLTSLAWLYGIANVAFLLWRGIPEPKAGMDAAGISAYWGAAYATTGIFVVADVLGPVVILGAIQMLRRRSYMFCKVTAVLAMLPLATHCVCVLTLPIGIWLLVVLLQPGVKMAFQGVPSDTI